MKLNGSLKFFRYPEPVVLWSWKKEFFKYLEPADITKIEYFCPPLLEIEIWNPWKSLHFIFIFISVLDEISPVKEKGWLTGYEVGLAIALGFACSCPFFLSSFPIAGARGRSGLAERGRWENSSRSRTRTRNDDGSSEWVRGGNSVNNDDF
jgi:hypothetical protein